MHLRDQGQVKSKYFLQNLLKILSDTKFSKEIATLGKTYIYLLLMSFN